MSRSGVEHCCKTGKSLEEVGVVVGKKGGFIQWTALRNSSSTSSEKTTRWGKPGIGRENGQLVCKKVWGEDKGPTQSGEHRDGSGNDIGCGAGRDQRM